LFEQDLSRKVFFWVSCPDQFWRLFRNSSTTFP